MASLMFWLKTGFPGSAVCLYTGILVLKPQLKENLGWDRTSEPQGYSLSPNKHEPFTVLTFFENNNLKFLFLS